MPDLLQSGIMKLIDNNRFMKVFSLKVEEQDIKPTAEYLEEVISYSIPDDFKQETIVNDGLMDVGPVIINSNKVGFSIKGSKELSVVTKNVNHPNRVVKDIDDVKITIPKKVEIIERRLTFNELGNHVIIEDLNAEEIGELIKNELRDNCNEAVEKYELDELRSLSCVYEYTDNHIVILLMEHQYYVPENLKWNKIERKNATEIQAKDDNGNVMMRYVSFCKSSQVLKKTYHVDPESKLIVVDRHKNIGEDYHNYFCTELDSLMDKRGIIIR